MMSERPWLGLFDYGALKRLFLQVLLLSLVLIAETALYSWAFASFAPSTILALTAGTGFLGFFYVAAVVKSLLKRILIHIKEGIFPELMIVRLLGVLCGGILLLLPGFLTDALGLLILLTFLKRVAGRILLTMYGTRIKGAYEYLKLS